MEPELFIEFLRDSIRLGIFAKQRLQDRLSTTLAGAFIFGRITSFFHISTRILVKTFWYSFNLAWDS